MDGLRRPGLLRLAVSLFGEKPAKRMRDLTLIFGMVLTQGAVAKAADACESTKAADMRVCLQSRLSTNDKELNEVYKYIMGGRSEEERLVLKDVQRKWLAFRDKFCESIRESNGLGSEAPIEFKSCMWLLTGDRVKELKRLVSYTDLKDVEFYRALRSLESAGFERSLLVNKLQNIDGGSREWNAYVESNCGVSRSWTNEDSAVCKARLGFLRSIH